MHLSAIDVVPRVPAEIFALFESLMLQALVVADKQAMFSSSLAEIQPLGHVSEAEH